MSLFIPYSLPAVLNGGIDLLRAELKFGCFWANLSRNRSMIWLFCVPQKPVLRSLLLAAVPVSKKFAAVPVPFPVSSCCSPICWSYKSLEDCKPV